ERDESTAARSASSPRTVPVNGTGPPRPSVRWSGNRRKPFGSGSGRVLSPRHARGQVLFNFRDLTPRSRLAAPRCRPEKAAPARGERISELFWEDEPFTPSNR